jgi:hypothetical protein
MEKEGFRPFEVERSAPRPGDRLVGCSLAWPQPVPEAIGRRLQRERELVYTPRLPLRVMHNLRGAQANFYASLDYPDVYGVAPYSLSRQPVERFTVYVFR